MRTLNSLTRRLEKLEAATRASYAPAASCRIIIYDATTGAPLQDQAPVTGHERYVKRIWLPEKYVLRIPDNGRDSK